jgi:hypothetical protein
MKQIFYTLLVCILCITTSFADEKHAVKIGQQKAKEAKMRTYFEKLKVSMPDSYEVISSYFKARTCADNFYAHTTKKDIARFVSSASFGILLFIKGTGNDKAYDQMLNLYRVMHCSGFGDAQMALDYVLDR